MGTPVYLFFKVVLRLAKKYSLLFLDNMIIRLYNFLVQSFLQCKIPFLSFGVDNPPPSIAKHSKKWSLPELPNFKCRFFSYFVIKVHSRWSGYYPRRLCNGDLGNVSCPWRHFSRLRLDCLCGSSKCTATPKYCELISCLHPKLLFIPIFSRSKNVTRLSLRRLLQAKSIPTSLYRNSLNQ